MSVFERIKNWFRSLWSKAVDDIATELKSDAKDIIQDVLHDKKLKSIFSNLPDALKSEREKEIIKRRLRKIAEARAWQTKTPTGAILATAIEIAINFAKDELKKEGKIK